MADQHSFEPPQWLDEMVREIFKKRREELPQTIASIKDTQANLDAARAKVKALREDPAVMRREIKRQLKAKSRQDFRTAWDQIKRSSRFAILICVGYLLSRPNLAFSNYLFIGLLALGFLAAEYQERKDVLVEAERRVSRMLVPIEEKHSALERLVEDLTLVLGAVGHSIKGSKPPS
jgi:hypothetical protein